MTYGLLLLAVAAAVLWFRLSGAQARDFRFQEDNWIAECAPAGRSGIDGGCSITAVFRDIHRGSRPGSFALLVGLQPSVVALVGRPYPLRGVLRIDQYPPFICAGERYCIFGASDTPKIIRQLGRGSLVLVDILTAKAVYRTSLGTKGYQADIAKIRAERF
jgi:hypothetical protein